MAVSPFLYFPTQKKRQRVEKIRFLWYSVYGGAAKPRRGGRRRRMKNEFIVTGITRIVLVGREEYSARKTAFSRVLTSHELIFHFSGRATVLFGGERLETAPGCVRFLPQGETTRYEVDRRECGECIDIFFRTDRPPADTAFVTSPAQKEKVGALFKKIFACWAGRGEGYYFDCMALLYEIFAELQKKTYLPSSRYGRIEPAVEAIHNDFLRRDFTQAELCALCGISPTYFRRLFKDKFGVSVKQYVLQRRLNHACDLLRLGRYTVTEVAEQCNFPDVYRFSARFKKSMGVTPTQFQRKYKSSK